MAPAKRNTSTRRSAGAGTDTVAPVAAGAGAGAESPTRSRKKQKKEAEPNNNAAATNNNAPADSNGYAAGLGGIRLANGSYITHGAGMNVKTVFSDLGFPVTMNELWPGTGRADAKNALSYGGQLGLIDFDTSIRLPRHVHIAPVESVSAQGEKTTEEKFIHERILVLEGVALVEMNGEVYVVPPRTLVTIAPGVPHTWTACPGGVSLEDAVGKGDAEKKTVSTGTFLMVYEYEDPTSFRPTRQTESMSSVDEYVACETEGLDEIRIPLLSADQVRETCWFLFDTEVKRAVGFEKA